MLCSLKFANRDACYVNSHGSFEETEPVNIISQESPETITRFYLHEMSTVKRFPSVFLEKFRNINLVHLPIGSISKLAKGDFTHGQNIEEIVLYMNKIDEIEDNAFEGMNKLKKISLWQNRLKRVRQATFAGLANLETLDLNMNDIEVIEEGALNLPKLTTLELSKNQIQTLPNSVLLGAPTLKEIFVGRNKLTHIGDMFAGLDRLEFIDLSFNQIDDLDLWHFAKIPTLRILYLSNTGVKIPTEAQEITPESKLESLDLGKNHLSQSDILTRLAAIFKRLRRLQLEENDFTTIDKEDQISELFPNIKKFKWRPTDTWADQI